MLSKIVFKLLKKQVDVTIATLSLLKVLNVVLNRTPTVNNKTNQITKYSQRVGTGI